MNTSPEFRLPTRKQRDSNGSESRGKTCINVHLHHTNVATSLEMIETSGMDIFTQVLTLFEDEGFDIRDSLSKESLKHVTLMFLCHGCRGADRLATRLEERGEWIEGKSEGKKEGRSKETPKLRNL